MSRIDYFQDPSAPKANSVVPSVTAVVCDEAGRLLIIHKTDNDLWALPGGGHDIGERIGDTVVREVEEETGIRVEVDGIVGSTRTRSTCLRTTTARSVSNSRSASGPTR